MKRLSGLAFRYMKENIQRTCTTIIGVMFATILIYGIFSCGINAYESSMKKGYEESLNLDAVYVVDAEIAKEMIKQAPYYGETPGIENDDYEVSHAYIVGCSKKYSDAYGINDFDAMPVKFKIKKGTTPNGKNGVIVSDWFSKGQKLTVGSEMEVFVLSAAEDYQQIAKEERILDYRTNKTVCGIFDNTCMYIEDKLPGGAINITQSEFVIKLTDELLEGEVTVYVTFKDKKNLSAQAKALADDYGVDSLNYRVSEQALNTFHKLNSKESVGYAGFKLAMLACGALASMAVLFIIRNAFNISVNERSNDYGILRCIGLTRRQIVYIMAYEAFSIGFAGMALGIGVSHLICKLAFFYINTNIADVGDYRLYGTAVLWTAVCMLVVTMYSMVAPIEMLFKLNPIEALRKLSEIENSEKQLKLRKKYKNDKKGKRYARDSKKEAKKQIKESKRAEKLTRLFGVETGYAYKNVMRQRNRAMLSIVSFTVGMILFVSTSSLFRYFSVNINEVIGINLNSVDGIFTCTGYSEYETVKKDLSKLDCVMPLNTFSNAVLVKFDNESDSQNKKNDSLYLVGLPEDNYNALLERCAKRVNADDNPVICMPVHSESSDWAAKKTIDLTDGSFTVTPEACITNEEYSSYMFNIGNYDLLYSSSENIYIYNMDSKLTETLVMLEEKSSAQDSEQAEFYMYSAYSYGIKLDNKAEDLYKFDNYVENTLHMYTDYSTENRLIVNTVKMVGFVIKLLIAIILILFMVDSINIERSNLMIRKGEYGILSVIGMSRKQKRKMIMLESMLTTIVSVILGTILSFVISYGLNKGLLALMMLDAEEPYEFPALHLDYISLIISIGFLIIMGIIKMLVAGNEELKKA